MLTRWSSGKSQWKVLFTKKKLSNSRSNHSQSSPKWWRCRYNWRSRCSRCRKCSSASWKRWSKRTNNCSRRPLRSIWTVGRPRHSIMTLHRWIWSQPRSSSSRLLSKSSTQGKNKSIKMLGAQRIKGSVVHSSLIKTTLWVNSLR